MDILHLTDHFIFTSQAKQAFHILNCLADIKEGAIFILYHILNTINNTVTNFNLIYKGYNGLLGHLPQDSRSLLIITQSCRTIISIGL